MSLADDIRTQIQGEATDDQDVLRAYSEDTSIFHVTPKCVVFPKDVDDLRSLVRFANAHLGELSLTARAAGTDMSGGPLNDSVIVSFTKYFNRILSVEGKTARTQPGVYYRDFEKETLTHGVLLPSYTASRELNTVGGMVGNNSAGEKSLTYGKTERYVRELKVVLRDGNEYSFRKLSRQEYEEKKAQDDFEGEVYKKVDALLREHGEVIKKERPIVAKNSAGYGIWNVHNEKDDTFDLTQLFVGSQGTLGLISEITFDLVKPKEHTRMLIIFLPKKRMPELGLIINTVLTEKPESFESYDDKTFNVMLRVLPKLIKRLGGNMVTLGWGFLPEMGMVVKGGIPKLALMAEFAGDSDEEALAQAKRAQEKVLSQFGVAARVTRSENEGNKYWVIRRESFNLLRENVRGKHTAPFIDDISVSPQYLPEFIPKLYDLLEEYKLIYTVAGHVGDGNFHIIPLMDYTRPDFAHIIKELSDRVYTLVGEYQGSITGEHNDGLIRTPYLHKMFSSEMLSVFDAIKDIFDPDRIFNPHKKVDGDMDLLIRSIKHEANNS